MTGKRFVDSDLPCFKSLGERLDYFLSRKPEIHPTAYVHPSAVLIGAVRVGAGCSIWPGVVIRADINTVEIGEGSNVQDGSIIHLADELGVVIGNEVTIGHGCVIHACRLGDGALIGMRATVLDGACVGEEATVGANSLVTKGVRVPEGTLFLGSPARAVRPLTDEERRANRELAGKYRETARFYQSRGKS